MKSLIGLFLITILISCDKYEEVKKENIHNAFILNSSPTFKGYFYEGSDSSYHYFISKWNFAKDRYFKIPKSDLRVFKQYEFKKDNQELKIDLFKEDNEIFAENEFYTLYIARKK
jgi:hypothetical protein